MGTWGAGGAVSGRRSLLGVPQEGGLPAAKVSRPAPREPFREIESLVGASVATLLESYRAL